MPRNNRYHDPLEDPGNEPGSSTAYERDDGVFRDEPHDDAHTEDSEGGDDKVLSVSELLYSSSSYYAIAKPGMFAMKW